MRNGGSGYFSCLPRIVSAKAVRNALNVSPSTLWRMIARGEFPRATEISPGRVGWHEDDVREWIDRRFGRKENSA